MRWAFWFSLFGIVYTYAGYPALMWAMARLRPRRWRTEPVTPSVDIVLAVHNGIALLPSKIQDLLNLDYPNTQKIVIVSDGSSDGTAELLADQDHPRLTSIVLKEHVGKAVAVNAGMAECTADVILFVDIRPQIGPGAVQQLVNNFADPKVGCVNGELILRQDGHDATASAFSGVYWRYEEAIRTVESICGSVVGVYGGFYAIRRALATQQPAGIILDDMFQPLSIVRQGYRAVLDRRAQVFDTWPKTTGGEFDRKVRTLAGNFQILQLAPWTLTPSNPVLFQLISHKLMRLVVPWLMLLQLACSLLLSHASTFYAVTAMLEGYIFMLALGGLFGRIPIVHRLSSPASAVLVLNAAAVVGLYKFLFTRGPLWKIWRPASATAVEVAFEPGTPIQAKAGGITPRTQIHSDIAVIRSNQESV